MTRKMQRQATPCHTFVLPGGSTATATTMRYLPPHSMRWMALILLLCTLSAHATQPSGTGTIRGVVTDEKGEGLPGASISLLDAAGGMTGYGTVSDMRGAFSMVNVRVGRHQLRVTYVGYQDYRDSAVITTAGMASQLAIHMIPQAIQLQTPVVTAIKRQMMLKEETVSMEVMRSENIRSVSPVASYSMQKVPGVSMTGSKGRVRATKDKEKQMDYVVVSGSKYAKKAMPASAGLLELEYDMAAVPAAPDMQQVPDMTVAPVDATGTESYKEIQDNKFLSAAAASLSTFSIDVDVASYGITRRKIREGTLPPHDAVRIEEMVNYFPYQYDDPKDSKPFAVHTELADCPWDATHQLLRIGIQGRHIPESQLPAANLVFLIDVSGSMSSYDKLPLVQRSLGMLVDGMRDKDHIAIVVYAGNAGLVLPSTSGKEKDKIKAAINNLEAGGSTAGGAGIELAYKTAIDNLIKDGNNRVILCTDGDFNVGISGSAALETFIADKRKTGVYLSVLGFGMGNYKDAEMEVLADKGNGNYAYIDNDAEAKKNLVTQLGGTLNTIAKDVKIQVVFNPGTVRSYRLIGYENRKLENRDFSNDNIDAGEIGSGTAVTALYEVVLSPEQHESTVELEDKGPDSKMALAASDLMALRIRYKAPDSDSSQLIESHVAAAPTALASTSDDFRFAASVASFGMLLRGSAYKGDFTYDKVKTLAKGSLGPDKEKYRHDFVAMVDQARAIATRTASK